MIFRKFDCVGPSAIYRMSLSILCLFMLMMVISLCRNRVAMVINEGLFCVKYIFVSAMFIAFLWIRNNVFDSYSQASQYISIVFMIIQVSTHPYLVHYPYRPVLPGWHQNGKEIR